MFLQFSSFKPIWHLHHFYVFFLVLFFLSFVFSRAASAAYGGSQDRGQNQSYSHRPAPQPQQHQIQAESVTYTTAHSNTGSLNHWTRPGIEPASSCILVRFVSAEPRQEVHFFSIFNILDVAYLSSSAVNWPFISTIMPCVVVVKIHVEEPYCEECSAPFSLLFCPGSYSLSVHWDLTHPFTPFYNCTALHCIDVA